MKKVIRFISMFIVLTFTLVISGCKEERPTFDKKNFTENGEVVVEVKEGYTFVGYLKNDIDNKTAVLYLPGSTIPQGEYEIIFVEDSKVNQTTKVYSYPEIANDGLTFAGWYTTNDFQKGIKEFRLIIIKVPIFCMQDISHLLMHAWLLLYVY